MMNNIFLVVGSIGLGLVASWFCQLIAPTKPPEYRKLIQIVTTISILLLSLRLK